MLLMLHGICTERHNKNKHREAWDSVLTGHVHRTSFIDVEEIKDPSLVNYIPVFTMGPKYTQFSLPTGVAVRVLGTGLQGFTVQFSARPDLIGM